MDLHSSVFSYSQLPGLFVLLARAGGFLLVVPFFSMAATPMIVRGGLALAVAIAMQPVYGPGLASAAAAELVVVAAKEVALGVFLGWLISVLFAGLQLAGQLAGSGIGLSMARVIDPGAATEDSLGPALYQYIGIMLFLSVGGHRELLAALMSSYKILPPGGVVVTAPVVKNVLRLSSDMFQAGLRLAAPVAALLFLVDLLLALANRVVPQIPILLLGMPVKAWLGIAALGWGLAAFAPPCLTWLERAPRLVLEMTEMMAAP